MNAANEESVIRVAILVIGGGTAGTVAAIKAKEALRDGAVLLLEKANVKRSGAIALGRHGKMGTNRTFAATFSRRTPQTAAVESIPSIRCE